MNFDILKDSSTKLSVCLEENEVVINYFSIFDTDTFESESMTLSFDRDSFSEELGKLQSEGCMRVTNERTSLTISRKNGYTVELSREGNSTRLMGVEFDVEALEDFLKR